MNSVERYFLVCKILATAGLLSEGLYYSVTQPGRADFANSIIFGLSCYCIWFARARTK